MKSCIILIGLLFYQYNISQAQINSENGEFKLGTWVGSVNYLSTHKSIVAARFDNFLNQPDSSKEFPRMQAMLKLFRGGFDTAEYQTSYFQSIDFDFDQNIATIDSEGNDLVFVGKILKKPRLNFSGTFSSKSSSSAGTFYFEYQDDEPVENLASNLAQTSQFVTPTLAGEYAGFCKERYLKLQLEAYRDETKKLSFEWPYSFSGRLSLEHDVVCLGFSREGFPKQTCIFKSYSRGTFDAQRSLLTISGEQGSDTCSVRPDGSLTCDFFVATENYSECALEKIGTIPKKFLQAQRKFNVSVPAESRTELPAVSPPKSEELRQALSGTFLGYLHHESLDVYQKATMNVSATTSTENMHIPNMVYISSTFMLDFFPATNASIFYAMAKRSAYFRPGYVLSDANGDGMILVEEWKRGYVSGTFYSKTFGRVGTIQLLKTADFPKLPQKFKEIPHVLGSFVGPSDKQSSLPVDTWSFTLNAVAQKLTYLNPFPKLFGNGSLNADSANFPALQITIKDGYYDFFTNNFSFMRDYGRESLHYVNGFRKNDELFIFWPSAPKFGVVVTDREFLRYRAATVSKELK